MMQQLEIIRNKTRPLSQDYEQLRRLGLNYIEQFSREIWTDYNIHDPGITILEALMYAITDLGYRTALPMEDLLARGSEDATRDFFTAREILPCNPVSMDDLRKKIIDVEGVENAWVLPFHDPPCADEVTKAAYYMRCNTSPKSIDLHCIPQDGFEAVSINGLYEFQLLLEEDSVLGDLNILSVDWELRHSLTGVRRALIQFIFPISMDKTFPLAQGVKTIIEQIISGVITAYSIDHIDLAGNTFDLTLNPGPQEIVIPKVAFHIQPVHTTDDIATLKNDMIAYLETGGQEVIVRIFSIFSEKVKRISAIMDEVYCMYQRIRNLCEDVAKISLVPSQEIAICADIQTDQEVDLEEILGRIWFAVDTFFSPPVRFYILKELFEKGYTSQEIFDGPLLKHGFLLDDELQKHVLFGEVHVSDLYNLIMSVPGVRTITYLQVTNYYNGQPLTGGEFWKIILNQDKTQNKTLPADKFHLNLDRLRSKITFYKGNMPIRADRQIAGRVYSGLKAGIARSRYHHDLNILNDILPPDGKVHDLEDYYSVQNELPHAYGVNRDGIPAKSDIIRKTRIKQLKGYLLFFDQLLANYLAQLSQLKNLYAIGNQNPRTYFSQPVYDTPLKDNTETQTHYSLAPVMPDPEALNFYDTAPLLRNFNMQPTADPDDSDSYHTAWTTFVNEKQNDYRKSLDQLTEPQNGRSDRRNRFLDHLLARFAESFADYAAVMYAFTGGIPTSSNRKTAEEIAEDKFHFLQQYHILSYNRGRGQYYKCCPSGDCNVLPAQPINPTTDDILEYDSYNIPQPSNPTGLHKRAALMLGMAVHDNGNLVMGRFLLQPSGSKFRFAVQYDQTHTLVSADLYNSEKEAFSGLEKVVDLTLTEGNPDSDNIYFTVQPSGAGFRIEVRLNPADVNAYAVSKPVYGSEEEAKAAIPLLKKVFMDEGMHIIEHLLLRPLPVLAKISSQDLNDGFFPLCPELNPGCDCPVTDYYAFRISVILPGWTGRFRNMDFRAFVEDTIHRETPAHILPKFCWVSMYDMYRLETVYTAWFDENKKYKPDMNKLQDLLKALILVLNTLTNVYPEGHLHDCDNPSTDNPVILNQTILGTFNPS